MIALHFVADSFHTKKLCNKLPSIKVRFSMEYGRAVWSFWAPLGGGRGTYDVHLRLIGKCIVDFLLVLIELLLLGAIAEALRANIGW